MTDSNARRPDQFKIASRSDKSIVNLIEPFRISSFDLLERYLGDPVLYVTVTVIFLICQTFTKNSSFVVLLFTFALVYWVVNHHIESFRSFKCIRSYLYKLSSDDELRRYFLTTHLGYSNQRCICLSDATKDLPYFRDVTRSSFNWLNTIIANFWPYLSHVIHYELDEFLREQIESGSLAVSEKKGKRLFYALVRQLDTNILIVERCQLGSSAPYIKDIAVFSSDVVNRDDEEIGQTKKTLSFDIDFGYNGDMNIALVYRYFFCCSSRFGLKDVYLHTKARVTLGPIEYDLPVVDLVSLTLLELPDFGYKGIALVELAELRLARSAIYKLIESHILYPRLVSINIRDIYDRLANGPVEKKQIVSPDTMERQRNAVSLWTKCMARCVLCSCLCSNWCLRCCQRIENDPRDQRREFFVVQR